jgi:hypothetical protein
MIRALIGDALDLPFYHTLIGVGLERNNNTHALNITDTKSQLVPFVIDAIWRFLEFVKSSLAAETLISVRT